MKLNKNKIQRFFLLFVIITSIAPVINGEAGSDIYQEKVHINIGRNTYIAGEGIWLKAYCYSNSSVLLKTYSKVLYVELVDYKSRHILGHILEIKNGISACNIQIPDTLSSGLYFIKGYTNWMKNFDESNFSSTPVYIYNNYDESNSSEIINYNIQPEPDIYIQGGKLIHSIPTTITIHIPGLFGREIIGRLLETPQRDSIIREVKFDNAGFMSFNLTPLKGVDYSIVCGDSLIELFRFNLPDVVYSGYSIELISTDNQGVIIRVNESETLKKPMTLNVVQNSEIIHKIVIENSLIGKDIIIPLTDVKHSEFDLRLEGNDGIIYASQSFIHSPNALVNFSSLNKEVKINEKSSFEISFSGLEDVNAGNFSVDIYKKEPSICSAGKYLMFSDFENKYIAEYIGEDIYVVYPLLSSKTGLRNTLPLNDLIHPVEDIGIIFSGSIQAKSDGVLPEGIEVILSVKDTLADMQSSVADSKGNFVFLIDKYKSMEGYIELLKANNRLTNEFNLKTDDKFYYSSKSNKADLFKQFSNPEFSNEIRNETQRVIIQRAFDNLNSDKSDSLIKIPYSEQAFYGDPLIVIYPGEFFLLPNFEEITREIVPRVRYRKNKSQCKIIVVDVENGIKSNTPLVILDGMAVYNLCDLQLLNSDHIQRIEVQSGLRIAGNYLYNGLVAIYTADDYKVKSNKRSYKTTFNVPGYSYSPDFAGLYESSNYKGRNHPDFKNHLYWNPELSFTNGDKVEVEFFTSDELGEYVIEICGVSKDGTTVYIQETFFVVR